MRTFNAAPACSVSVGFQLNYACACSPFPASSADNIPWGPTTDDVDRRLSKHVPALAVTPDDPEFWMDMVEGIPTNGNEFVDLQLNPERNTGFNGSLVWAAIYQENCFQRGGTGCPIAGI